MIYQIPELNIPEGIITKQSSLCLVHPSDWKNEGSQDFIQKVLLSIGLEKHKNIDLFCLEVDDYIPIRYFDKAVKRIILFGIMPSQLGLQAFEKWNHVYHFLDKKIIFALPTASYQEYQEKSALWEALKQLTN